LDRIHTSDHIGSVDWIGLDRLILLKCDTHSEHMVTIGMGKQVQSMGYDRSEPHVIQLSSKNEAYSVLPIEIQLSPCAVSCTF
jgi:hypothetical protein